MRLEKLKTKIIISIGKRCSYTCKTVLNI